MFLSVQHNFVDKRDEIKLLMFLGIFWTNDRPVIPANWFAQVFCWMSLAGKGQNM